MNLEEYREQLENNIADDYLINGFSQTQSICKIFTDALLDAQYLPEEVQATDYAGIGFKRNRKIRVDAYLQDKSDESLYLFLADYIEDGKNLTRTAASSDFKALMSFVDEALTTELYAEIEPSIPAADLIDLIRAEHEYIQKYNLVLLTNGKISTQLNELKKLEIDGKPAECTIWGCERLFELYTSTSMKEPIRVDFSQYIEGGIPCIPASSADKCSYNGYLGVIPGSVLAAIYEQYGSRLLEGNVRSFLSTKRAVNKKIRSTILNEPTMFFAFNNGIAVTAQKLIFSDNYHLMEAEDFQIINGGQTTASLFNSKIKDKADLRNIYVQMKLTEIGEMESDKADELISSISRASNSQNKVSEADFFANHPFHKVVEQISRRVMAPPVAGSIQQTYWFYERARGQYIQAQMALTKAQQKKFQVKSPKSQVITKTDLAKYRFSWEERPYLVSKGAQTNFMKFAEIVDSAWEKDNSVFNEVYFKETVALDIIFHTVERIVSEQEWYKVSHSYRANIVTYSISLLHFMLDNYLRHKAELNLLRIWEKQKMPDSLYQLFVPITKWVHDFITRDKNANVTQWCKQEQCWQNMKKEAGQLNLPWDSVVSEVVLKQETRGVRQAAKKEQKIDSGIELLKKLYEIPEDKWWEINKLASELHCIVNQKEKTALNAFVKGTLHDWQAEFVMAVLQRLEDEGHCYIDK